MSRGPALTSLYRPITATPFKRSAAYTELPPPPALQPYIRCFWGTPEPIRAAEASADQPSLVIPDTCMDIIFSLDYTHQTLFGRFCAMDENAYPAYSEPSAALCSTFAIRFYAWTAVLFAERPLSGSRNQSFDAAAFFPSLCEQLIPMLTSVSSLSERARVASLYLLQRLDTSRARSLLMNAVDSVINARGAIRVADLAARNAVSRKQLERVFDEQIGVSPKAFASLVRYQLLWQELCFGRDDHALDLVEKYGYFDQAHLLNDFKKRHAMTPSQALRFASE